MKVEKVLVLVLAIALAVSLFLNAYLYLGQKQTGNPTQEKHSPTFFSFSWNKYSQKLLNGTLYLNLTFEIVNENLTVKAEAYLGYYDPNVTLALQFDSDDSGTIEVDPDGFVYQNKELVFFLRANNYTRPGDTVSHGLFWLPNGEIGVSSSFCGSYPWEIKSPYHYCTYKNGTYTFHFSYTTKVSPNTLDDLAIKGKLVRVLFGIVPWNGVPKEGMSVYIPPFKFME